MTLKTISNCPFEMVILSAALNSMLRRKRKRKKDWAPGLGIAAIGIRFSLMFLLRNRIVFIFMIDKE